MIFTKRIIDIRMAQELAVLAACRNGSKAESLDLLFDVPLDSPEIKEKGRGFSLETTSHTNKLTLSGELYKKIEIVCDHFRTPDCNSLTFYVYPFDGNHLDVRGLGLSERGHSLYDFIYDADKVGVMTKAISGYDKSQRQYYLPDQSFEFLCKPKAYVTNAWKTDSPMDPVSNVIVIYSTDREDVKKIHGEIFEGLKKLHKASPGIDISKALEIVFELSMNKEYLGLYPKHETSHLDDFMI
jgi:hypothetical protein